MKEKSKIEIKSLGLKSLTLIILTIVMLMLSCGKVNAVLQANYTTHTQTTKVTKSGSEWIKQIRNMEESTGAMGLSASVGSNLTDTTTGDKNGIDIHMIKTTEWGAVEILAASGYGSGRAADVNNKTTTKNSTGVYFDGKTEEWTAGVGEKQSSYNAKYYNIYAGLSSNESVTATNGGPKAGDGLGLPTLSGTGKFPGCAGWKTSGKSTVNSAWIPGGNYGFSRGGAGLFSFYGGSREQVWSGCKRAARGVVVVGAGL